MYNYGARFYSPYLNRWIEPDTIIPDAGNPQALNRYSYCLNNPLRYRDPSGHFPITPFPFPDQWLPQAGEWIAEAWTRLQPWIYQLAADLGQMAEGGPAMANGVAPTIQSASDAGAKLGQTLQNDHGGETGNPDPNQWGPKQEQAVRDVLARSYEQRFGVTDQEIRTNLGLTGKATDFVGYNAQRGRWLIAESKGADLDSAFSQLGNTMTGLLRYTGSAANNVELHVYMNANQYQRLLAGNLGGWRARDGYLGWLNETGEWVWAEINGVRILAEAAQ